MGEALDDDRNPEYPEPFPTESQVLATVIGAYRCKHEPRHSTHMHEGANPPIPNRYDCDPECAVPGEDYPALTPMERQDLVDEIEMDLL